MKKTITLEIHQDLYDYVKAEVQKDNKRYHWSNRVPFLFMATMAYGMYWSDTIHRWDAGAVTCNYIITSDAGTSFFTGRSNITSNEVNELKNWTGNIYLLRETNCTNERQ